jgi:hypothetical protein
MCFGSLPRTAACRTRTRVPQSQTSSICAAFSEGWAFPTKKLLLSRGRITSASATMKIQGMRGCGQRRLGSLTTRISISSSNPRHLVMRRVSMPGKRVCVYSKRVCVYSRTAQKRPRISKRRRCLVRVCIHSRTTQKRRRIQQIPRIQWGERTKT